MKNIASVVISGCTREFDKEYHYNIPKKMKDDIRIGARVIVPFGRTNILKEGYVLNIIDKSNWSNLKDVKKLIDEESLLNTKMLELASWMKDRYICTYHDAIRCILPAGTGITAHRVVILKDRGNLESFEYKDYDLNDSEKKIIDVLKECDNRCELTELRDKVGIGFFQKYISTLEGRSLIEINDVYTTGVKEKSIRVAHSILPKEEIIEIIEGNRLKRIQQIKVLEILIDHEYVPVKDLVRFAGVSPGVLDTLKRYGYIDIKEVEVQRDPFSDSHYEPTTPLKLTKKQSDVYLILKDAIDKDVQGEYLLHGVTGSGKTEIYMQLILYAIQKGKNAIVLVPEISLTPQMVERFKGRFGNSVAVLHSRLSLGERYDQWHLIHKGERRVVIGARSAIFAPLENVGLIVIDEEHESSYKSEITPKYHAIDIARFICKQHNGVLLLGSATPSTTTYYKATQGLIHLLEIEERVNQGIMPKVELVDMREELNRGNRSVFSHRLHEEMEKNIELGQQTMLFLNRRGYASFVLCRNCGYVVKCVNCSITLTYHAIGDRLTCHYCGYTVRSPKECPKCKSKYIKHFGLGTQKLEEETKNQFPKSTVIRMDSDTTGYKNSHADILSRFRYQNINVMVGTQMIAKGHDFPNVTLVGVMAADGMLNLADYMASEKTFQLLTQVAGRAGRGAIPGRVIIQSYNIDDFSILAACKQDYKDFYRQEIMIRKEMENPPFTNIALIILSGKNDKTVQQSSQLVKKMIYKYFEKHNNGQIKYKVLGPLKPPISKIKNKYRWRLVIKSNTLDILVDVLRDCSDEYYREQGKTSVDLGIDIDPLNML